jgi:hypothetical protein
MDRVRAIARDGEDATENAGQQEFVLLTHRNGFLVPALVLIKVRNGGRARRLTVGLQRRSNAPPLCRRLTRTSRTRAFWSFYGHRQSTLTTLCFAATSR